jgi:hypothetical protein
MPIYCKNVKLKMAVIAGFYPIFYFSLEIKNGTWVNWYKVGMWGEWV